MKYRIRWLYLLLALLLFLTGLPLTGKVRAEERPKVAVVPFESIGVESSLGLAAAEILSTHLASQKHAFTVVERGQLQKALQELGYQASGFVDPDSAVAIGKQLGARYIVVGSVARFGDSYTLNARIVAVESAEINSVEPISARNLNPDFLISLSKQIGQKLDAMLQPEGTRSFQAPPNTPSSLNVQPAKPMSSSQPPQANEYPLVLIPAGFFWRGDTIGDGQKDELPLRKIYLDAFYLGKYEVTQAQYQRFILTTGRREPTHCDFGFNQWDLEKNADHPVVCVSWEEAHAFCAWAGMRLPSEAEWEKAARGEDRRRYAWGDQAPDCDRTSYSGCEGAQKGLQPVGSHPKGVSPYGIQDLTGSVWEWTQDWYDPDYYAHSLESNPQGPPKGKTKVLRGGSYGHDAWAIRISNRSDLVPQHRNAYTGIRCAR